MDAVYKSGRVERLPRVELGERRRICEGLFGALPRGWTLSKTDDAWLVEGSSRPGGDYLRPRLAGTRFSKSMTRRSQIRMALQEAERAFENWSVKEKGFRELGMHQGYEICGGGEFRGSDFHTRQILVWVGNSTWLLSCIWPAKDEKMASLMEGCLQSLEFAASR